MLRPRAGFFQVSFPSPSLPLTSVKCDQIVSKQFTLFSIYLINTCFLNRSTVFHCALCIVFVLFIVHNLKLVLIVSIVCQTINIVSLFTHLAAHPEAQLCSFGLPVLRSGVSRLVIAAACLSALSFEAVPYSSRTTCLVLPV